MGDPLGSPRVAPLFCFCSFYFFFPRRKSDLNTSSLLAVDGSHIGVSLSVVAASADPTIASPGRSAAGMTSNMLGAQLLTGATIPALTHRIPSELRS